MSKLRILIADDHEQMRWQLVHLLGLEFEVVGCAPDGEKLVELALSLNPDVIVSDIRMPVLTGPEAMKVLRLAGHAIPFVLVSINSCGAKQFIEEGATAFVDKLDAGYELTPAVHLAALRITYLSRSVRLSIEGDADDHQGHTQFDNTCNAQVRG